MRIPFEEAIEEEVLFRQAWYGTGKKGDLGFSTPQKAILKAIYGLALTDEERDTWHALNTTPRIDALGYLLEAPPPFPYVEGQEAREITLILGRRFAKTTISSFVIAYEALCGGHHEHLGRASRQVPTFIQIAQDLDTAKTNLRQHILSFLESSPIGRIELGNLQESVTATEIRLKRATIEVAAPTIKVRGKAAPIIAFDELAYWAKDVGAAAQDVEIERAVTPAMIQFPFRKLIKTSTPATKQGLLWDAFQQGTYGHKKGAPTSRRSTIVLRGPSALSGNPTLSRAELAFEHQKDPENFQREFLAEFTDAQAGFLSLDLLQGAMKEGVARRPKAEGFRYVAAMDAAFRHDAFAFTIGHMEDGAFVQDVLTSWRGAPTAPLSPTRILHEVAQLCAAYGLRSVLSDQHHLESLQELGKQTGLSIEPFIITGETKRTMWMDFAMMLNQGRLRLLDSKVLLGECAAMERVITPSGNVQYVGRKDDHAMVTALCLHRALQLGEGAKGARDKTPVTHADHFWAQQRKPKTSDAPWYA